MNSRPMPLQMSSPPDDESLLRQTAAGDHHAFAQLVRIHQTRVVQLATRLLSSPNKAEDIAQEAFLRVFRNAAKFEPRARFATWLYRIVVNLCHDERRRWRFAAEWTEREPAAPQTPDPTELNDLKATVHRAIDRLPPRQKAVLVLHRFEGLSYREIGETLDLSESAVESLLVRGYAHLRESLKSISGS